MTHFPHDEPMLDATLRVDQMPAVGRDIVVESTEAQRAALAELLGITSIEALDATMKAVKFRGGIRVEGRLKARITQPCVITFEPVHQQIDEPIDRVFLPGANIDDGVEAGNKEIFVDLENDDPPDPLDGPELDLAPLVTETLALAIDPYPRAPGASVDDLGLTEDSAKVSAFDALRSLKDTKSGQ